MNQSWRSAQPDQAQYRFRRLYELWLDSICETVKALDPEWTAELEAHWRVRMRAGMQIIMAAY